METLGFDVWVAISQQFTLEKFALDGDAWLLVKLMQQFFT